MDMNLMRELCEKNFIYMTEHVILRCRQRNIRQADFKNCIITGEIIEDYPEGYPYPSCLILGCKKDNTVLHVVAACNSEYIKIVTAYYPDKNKWESDMRTRR